MKLADTAVLRCAIRPRRPGAERNAPLPRMPVHLRRRTEYVHADAGERAVTREFCAACGTHLITRRPGLPPVVLKIGTLDDPSIYGGAQMAIFTAEGQPFHLIADGVPAFDGLPPPRA